MAHLGRRRSALHTGGTRGMGDVAPREERLAGSQPHASRATTADLGRMNYTVEGLARELFIAWKSEHEGQGKPIHSQWQDLCTDDRLVFRAMARRVYRYLQQTSHMPDEQLAAHWTTLDDHDCDARCAAAHG
jgi:hypothetical protein